jgi:hypothetical protein
MDATCSPNVKRSDCRLRDGCVWGFDVRTDHANHGKFTNSKYCIPDPRK